MENGEIVDQRRAAAEAFLARHGERLKRQGAVVATYRRRDDRRVGPYYRLVCRCEGRQISVYLGAAGPLVEEVRRRLADLQGARTAARRRWHVRRALRRQAAAVRRDFDAELRPLGLYRKGNEVRGWRSPALRRPSTYIATAPLNHDGEATNHDAG